MAVSLCFLFLVVTAFVQPAAKLLGLVQALGWTGGPNLAPLVPAILLALIWREAQREPEPLGLSASASEAVPEPRLAGAG